MQDMPFLLLTVKMSNEELVLHSKQWLPRCFE